MSRIQRKIIGQNSQFLNQSHKDINFSKKWRAIPDFDFTPNRYTGPSYEKVLSTRDKHLSKCAMTVYRNPVMIVQGKMQYLFDHTGRRYLDLFAGASTSGMGHCHPRVIAKMKEQIDNLNHTTTVYLNDQHSMFAEELADKLPKGLDCIYFTSSGSEANALATQMARAYTKNYSILTFRNGYHGMGGAKHLTNIMTTNMENIPETQGVEKMAFPDLYRGPFSENRNEAGAFYAQEVKDTIDFNTPGKIALFMAEPIQGFGGIHPMPENFIPKAVEHVRAAGGLYLSDEVQTGFGRLGSHYWGHQAMEMGKPDIITMAKMMGNGFPIAAVATTKEIANCFGNKITFSTYGGNPIAMATGREVLKVIDEEKLQENCQVMGALFMKGLKEIQNKYVEVGDVRGTGLMIGIELVTDSETKAPNNKLFADVFEKTKDHGILLGKGGRFGNVFRLQPPMCLNAQDVEFALDVIDRSLMESGATIAM